MTGVEDSIAVLAPEGREGPTTTRGSIGAGALEERFRTCSRFIIQTQLKKKDG